MVESFEEIVLKILHFGKDAQIRFSLIGHFVGSLGLVNLFFSRSAYTGFFGSIKMVASYSPW
jgi:hypothetical protein